MYMQTIHLITSNGCHGTILYYIQLFRVKRGSYLLTETQFELGSKVRKVHINSGIICDLETKFNIRMYVKTFVRSSYKIQFTSIRSL